MNNKPSIKTPASVKLMEPYLSWVFFWFLFYSVWISFSHCLFFQERNLTLKILLYCLFSSIVSDKKSAVFLIFVICLFTLVAFRIVFLSLIVRNLIMMSLGIVFLMFLELEVYWASWIDRNPMGRLSNWVTLLRVLIQEVWLFLGRMRFVWKAIWTLRTLEHFRTAFPAE